MAEAIVSTILEQLRTMTVEKASEAWSLVRGVEKEVKRLESNFKALQFELEDAEEREHFDKQVKHWLDKFRDVSYDMEDVLADWEIAVQQLQKDDSSRSVSKWDALVFPFVSCFSSGLQVARRHDIASKIKEINEELDQIANDRVRSELIKRETKQRNRSESTSFVQVSELIGRDAVKQDIIRILLSQEHSRNVSTVSITGMGGIGKTAIAQLIYNDPTIQSRFNKISWVCASNPFDQGQIARAILEDLDFDSLASLNKPTLQSVLHKLSEKLRTTKFLFIFDDVWTDRDQDWEQLKATFNYGMPGSWILVTTRNESVARRMESIHVVPLELLSEKMCWLILAQKAFSGRNQVSRENLQDIGREISKKCRGLPLAAKTLGGLLQDKRGREEWRNILNSVMWRSDFAQEIFSPLLLSYYDLPSPIRQCLSYCAIFPNNHTIKKDELIQCWMAQGYLNTRDDTRREMKGEDYFNFLAARSFFQDFEKDAYGTIISCKMHDMTHEFVQFLTEHRILTTKVVQNLKLDLSSKKTRHLRLVIRGRRFSHLPISGIEKLRSLVIVSENGISLNSIFEISRWMKRLTEVPLNRQISLRQLGDSAEDYALQNLISRCKLLRILEFDSFHLRTEEIGRGMKNLIHLRYLSLISCFGLENLPDAVCELINIQSLNLQNCFDLKGLPVGIGKLINLKYLCIKDCVRLTYYPKGIGNLTSLIRLSGVKIRTDESDGDQFSIGDLENLDLLGGNLRVELVGNEIDLGEANRAKLQNKIHLKRMDIWICSEHIKEEEVLGALNPPASLFVVMFDYPRWLASNGAYMKRISIPEKIGIGAKSSF